MTSRWCETKLFALIGAGAAATLGALVIAAPNDSSREMTSTGMSTGVTVTATTPSTTSGLSAAPSITGPAPLPPEEQGLPGG